MSGLANFRSRSVRLHSGNTGRACAGMKAFALLVAVGLVVAPGVGGSLETAAHGSHLAWCLGLAGETAGLAPDASEAARSLANEMRTRIAELELGDDLVAEGVRKGAVAAVGYLEAGRRQRLDDALAGCRTSLLTGVR